MPATPPSPSHQPTVAIETHGCKLNQADSGVLSSDFARAGFRLVSGEEACDVYLVNTCTVTHVADRKARHALRAARRRHPNATIVATGCYAQRSPEALRALAEVDLVAGNTEKAELVRQVVSWRGASVVPCATGAETEQPGSGVARTRAMIKIQEGCDQVCAYCIVPRVRGRERSIPPEEIIGRIEEHVSRGYKEAVLTGTQLGTYGFDLHGVGLPGLIERILAETDVARLRVSSLQPQEIDADLLSLWSDSRLAPHFHLPLQSGSDAVLHRMRRRYTARLYADTVKRIRHHVPVAAVTADVIAGFPGETEEQFDETVALCEGLGFASLHAFPYSVRPGTSAAHFGEQIDAETKSRRVAELVSLSKRHAGAFRVRFIGAIRPVLWEGPKQRLGDGYYSGLTDNYIRVVAQSRAALTNLITLARLDRQEGGVVVATNLEKKGVQTSSAFIAESVLD